MNHFERPALLTFGIVLSALHALFVLACLGLAVLAMTGAAGVGVASAGPQEWAPLALAFSLGGAVIGLFMLFYAGVLWVCHASWHGSRTALAALIGLSVLGAMTSGPLSALISVLTVIGCIQAWERAERRGVVANS